jgi:D-aminopeptidase
VRRCQTRAKIDAMKKLILITVAVLCTTLIPTLHGVTAHPQGRPAEDRPRARELGIVIGSFPSGPLDAITDVAGVSVGQVSLIKDPGIRTGVTVIVPHQGDVFWDKVPAAVVVGNGYGKLTGSTQIEELGNLETPILLCGTLNVPRVADALISVMLRRPGMDNVLSINPVVGETNDGAISDIRGRQVGEEEVRAALSAAATGPVAEGTVGAGVGTRALGFKGGIGTSSRIVDLPPVGPLTVGVLVQTNFGGVLRVNGVPVGDIVQSRMRLPGPPPQPKPAPEERGSCMIVVATDAPLESRNLRRLASRALAGMARAGASFSNGSGDYVIAFSSAPCVRIHSRQGDLVRSGVRLGNDAMSPLFAAVSDATEEAILNSLLRATDIVAHDGTLYRAVPIDLLIDACRERGALPAQGE